MSSTANQPIAVIGGGITGLAAAHRLALEGRQVRLFEATPRLGGSVHSERAPGGWLVETGPNTILAKTSALDALIERIGLTPRRLAPSPRAAKRFLVRNAQLMPLPASALSAITTKLFSLDLKWRIAREYFTALPRQRPADIPLAQLAREHYGDEFVDYALNPMCAGIYAGDPEKLSARHAMPFIWDAERDHGSIVRGQLAQARARRASGGPKKSTLLSFPDGLRELPDALAARLPRSAIETNARVESIAKMRAPASDEPRWQVRWTRTAPATPTTPATRIVETEIFSKILLALPAPALARLCVAPQPMPAAGAEGFYTPLEQLAEIETPPVASLYLGYKRAQVAHKLDGFGALVPEVEKLPFLGVLFSSSLYPEAAPRDHIALTVMIGGTRQPGLARLPEQQLADLVAPALEKLLGVRGAPVFQRLTAHEHAIPQYNLGHEKHLALIDEFERTHPGIVIAGNARDGIAVPACLASGETRAESLL